ncbi:hypothetical protein QBC33DRAFT_50082 [Phialemonium atrogriseum]|uniref:AAA+ ATPase domain-containing protein n=1 Tax=Phialemonium atrogriseum TaxID=1093897 RepID=A0AAJ0C3V7_9PEZI|nr:uncharacterized protein QBC33DRAFT_50082 [Phialemonium atrogriseum]KAK1768244.1 hypothetical protein QBC33DRAFT_50082 [Phialemonium atrogriseum]
MVYYQEKIGGVHLPPKTREATPIQPSGAPRAPQVPIPATKHQAEISRPVSKLPGTLVPHFIDAITISDDLSDITKVEERQLLALRDRKANQSLSLVQYRMIQRNMEESARKAAWGERRIESQKRFESLLETEVAAINMTAATTIMPPGGPSDLSNGQSSSRKRPLTAGLSVLGEMGADVLNMDVTELQSFIQRLEDRARQMGASESKHQLSYRHQVLYRILENKCVDDKSRQGSDLKRRTVLSPSFFDPPQWVGGQGKTGTLRCQIPLQNFDLFLEKNKDISFFVYRTYVVPEISAQNHRQITRSGETEDIPDITINESIQPITDDLVHAINALLESREDYGDLHQEFQQTSELRAPYLFIYHRRQEPDAVLGGLDSSAKEQMMLFWNYVMERYGDDYAAADALISQGKITSNYVKYLFKPGDVIIQKSNDQHLGWIAKSWASPIRIYATSRRKAEMARKGAAIPLYGSKESSKLMATDKVMMQDWEVSAWQWDFDGHFQRRDGNLLFSTQIGESSMRNGSDVKDKSASKTKDDAGEVIAIDELNVFPIQHAPAEVVAKLRRRGQVFWKCRNRAFVSYRESDEDSDENLVDERYVVDLQTYRSLHKDNLHDGTRSRNGLADELGPEAMARGEPPDDQFELLLPATIKGFNLRRKKWYDLVAERVTDVKWNKEAFSKVVMDHKAKDLIRALVSNQLEAEQGTDLIEGKGNGLILLLHGSPGTGKTLTAESVAEIAEKPLYRVTCGDVGTKAEDVETYLESVLHLGKLWGCVVLLDEADVFLEQRSLEDLQRNALVSVFLRVLEYYEGILILTSNRVGIFDEAFKSRIQLALHYPTLGPYQRLRIWENFLDRLEKFEDDSVDIADLRDHLDDLKREEMNGRQIRNAITTARQYSKWKEQTLTYAHLKDVIEVSGLFDKYLNKLHGGFTQDQLAEDEGLRLG